jgi:peroxiredoxin
LENQGVSMKYLLATVLILIGCHSEPPPPLAEQIKQKKESLKAPEDVQKLMKDDLDRLIKMGLSENALGKGNKLPDFEMLDEKGEKVSISSLYEKAPLVITFYRGGWCPYCMLELKTYEALLEKFTDAGSIVIGISPETIMELKKTRKKNDLSFALYSDKDNAVAKKLGLSFKMGQPIIDLYKKFEIDLSASQGNDENVLPMPGTYVIDKKGVIRFAFFNSDYTLRAEPTEVLKIVKGLNKIEAL